MEKKTNVDHINDIWGRVTTALKPKDYTNTLTFDPWTSPMLIDVREMGESIEFIYKQRATTSFTTYFAEERVFKIVYSCIEGKWNKSAPIYGEIIPPQSETYLFKNEKL